MTELRQRMNECLQLRCLSERTQAAYVCFRLTVNAGVLMTSADVPLGSSACGHRELRHKL